MPGGVLIPIVDTTSDTLQGALGEQHTLWVPVPCRIRYVVTIAGGAKRGETDSMPTSVPVPGKGCGTTTQDKTTYHCPTLWVRHSVLTWPGHRRCQRTAIQPMLWTLSLRLSTLQPLPYALHPQLLKQLAPLQWGYPTDLDDPAGGTSCALLVKLTCYPDGAISDTPVYFF